MVGVSLTGVIVTFAVPITNEPKGSVALKVKLSLPFLLALGVYISLFATTLAVPALP